MFSAWQQQFWMLYLNYVDYLSLVARSSCGFWRDGGHWGFPRLPSIKTSFAFFFPPTYTTWWWKPEGTRKIPRERQWEQKHFDLITFLSGERFLLITVSYQQFFSLSKPSFHLLPFSLFSLWLFIVTRVIHWDFLRVLTMFSVCVWKFKIGATMETQLKVGYLRNNARHQLKKYEGNGWVVNVR